MADTAVKVLMFRDRWEAPIRAGRKRSTIRPRRLLKPARAHEGETISLRVWTGRPYQSKQREVAQVTVRKVIPVLVGNRTVAEQKPGGLYELNKQQVATDEGFTGWPEMRHYFETTHGLPHYGWLIYWTSLTPGPR